ncbi:MAG: reverse transcriptase domain-containing protein, partial [Pseudomonadales bacterium]
CWEHLNVVWASLKDAKLNKSSLASIWLDIANAYGSIPHQLIFFALKRYGLPPNIVSIIEIYYAGLWSKSNSLNAPSGWHQHQRGIFTGCTVSVVLFLAGMNVALEYIKLSNSLPFTLSTSTTHVPLVRAFMDDLNLLSNSVAGTNDLLRRSEVVLNWARLSCRASKSRSFVCINGKVSSSSNFIMSDNQQGAKNAIPSIQSNPIKFLGRIIDGSLSDTQRFEELEKKLMDGLTSIDKSFHSGVNKSWILQYLLIPKIQWPLMVYEFPITKVETFENIISKYLRKWLGLCKSITNISLYGKCSPCPLPFSSISSIFKTSKARGYLQLRDSKDHHVSNAGMDLSCGRKWSVIHEVESAEHRVDHLKVMGHTQFNRAGLGSVPSTPVPHKGTPAYRKHITAAILQAEDEKRFASAVQLSVQGQWTKWQNYVSSDLSWKALWAVPPALTRFCIAATYDTLPSPNNLHRWGLSSTKSCPLCSSQSCTVAHVLSGCHFSLDNGRYTFRHDSVLKEIVLTLKEFLVSKGPSVKSKIHKVKFVRPGHQQSLKLKTTPNTEILHLSSDWVLIDDLEEKLVFPKHIVKTSDIKQRPDIVLYSDKLRRVILLELTCPCEENFSARHENKIKRYSPLKELCEEAKWTCDIFAFEVGARGYCSKSLSFMLKRLGLSNKLIKSVSLSAKMAALRASFWIWISRDDTQWKGSFPQNAFDTPLAELPKPNNHQKTSNHVSPKPVGIKNIGNTCYLSSILQAFKAIPSLNTKILNFVTFQHPILKALQLVTKLMDKRQHNHQFSIDPSSLVDSLNHLLRKGNPLFRAGQQQDVHEVIMQFFSQFSTQLLDQLFNSEVISITSCSVCHTSSTNTEIISVFQLPVRPSLEQAFDSFLSPETLDGGNEWFCPECNKHQISIRRSHISNVAKVLIVQLKRFNVFQDNICKNTNIVEFPLANFSVPCKDDEVELNRLFSLKATINHTGSLDSGHYKSMTLHNKLWYACNDSAILDINENKIVDESAYMLFFESC